MAVLIQGQINDNQSIFFSLLLKTETMYELRRAIYERFPGLCQQ